MTDWRELYRRMRNVAAGYSNHCEENGSTRKLDREFIQIEADAREQEAQPASSSDWRELLRQSEENFNRQFGINVAAAWAYRDMEDLLAAQLAAQEPKDD